MIATRRGQLQPTHACHYLDIHSLLNLTICYAKVLVSQESTLSALHHWEVFSDLDPSLLRSDVSTDYVYVGNVTGQPMTTCYGENYHALSP